MSPIIHVPNHKKLETDKVGKALLAIFGSSSFALKCKFFNTTNICFYMYISRALSVSLICISFSSSEQKLEIHTPYASFESF